MTLDLEHPGPDPTPSSDPTAQLARWLERRLDATTAWDLDEARLYGITVRDPQLVAEDADGAARFSLLDRGYPYDVVEGPAVLLAANFDAVALLTLGWQSPLVPTATGVVRPSRHPDRTRVRIVSVALVDPVPDAAAVATAVRCRGAEEADVHPCGHGRMVDALTNLAAEALATRLVA